MVFDAPPKRYFASKQNNLYREPIRWSRFPFSVTYAIMSILQLQNSPLKGS